VQGVLLASETDLAGWRTAARRLRAAAVPPNAVHWSVADETRLAIAEPPVSLACGPTFTTPARFLSLAADVVCHRSAARFDLLYRLLWRLADAPQLLGLSTDPEVALATGMAKAVSRAAHKMKAFLRFRQLASGEDEPETYVAWFEPPHRVVERTAGFFRDRFANQHFSILTPDLCCHWDGDRLSFTPGVRRPTIPDDDLEAFWLTYYRSIFNPARLKIAAMQSEMPKRYWRNLPEAALIAGLVAEAEARTSAMIESGPTRPSRRLPAAVARPAPAPSADDRRMQDLAQLPPALLACRRCDLWRDATQGVAGEGPSKAPLMLVGEQPGDLEDLEGRPFVGPAGQILSRALEAAGVSRADAYVTNAVKHFKHERRGKRRLHKTPDHGDVHACRWWLDQELDLVRPKLVVALGATAALALFGKAMPILKSRGRVLALQNGGEAMITVHPSYLLRLPDEAAKASAWKAFVEDLGVARDRLARA
jgi:probable DNA metabolism protein